MRPEEVGLMFREALAAQINATIPVRDLPGEEEARADSWYVVMLEVGLTQVGLRKLLAVLAAGYGNADFVVSSHKITHVAGGPSEAVKWSEARGEHPAPRKLAMLGPPE